MSMLIDSYRFGGGGGGGTDPNFSSVTSLLHFDGADGSTTFTDVKGISWSGFGSAQIDTAQFKFGSSSLYIPASGRIQNAVDNASWALGTGNFTIEFFVRLNAAPASFGIIFDSRVGSNATTPTVYVDSSRRLNYYVSGSAVITTSVTLTLSTWYHVAVVRNAGTTTLYINGTSSGTWSDSTNYTNKRMGWGDSTYSPGTPINGWLDDCRITKGVARYTANFTPPALPFPNS